MLLLGVSYIYRHIDRNALIGMSAWPQDDFTQAKDTHVLAVAIRFSSGAGWTGG